MALTEDNLVVVTEAFRSGEVFAEYLADWKVDPAKVFEQTQIDIRQEITTHDQAMQFCYFCQLFWELLPDSSRIRYGAFFLICDFAEFYMENS